MTLRELSKEIIQFIDDQPDDRCSACRAMRFARSRLPGKRLGYTFRQVARALTDDGSADLRNGRALVLLRDQVDAVAPPLRANVRGPEGLLFSIR